MVVRVEFETKIHLFEIVLCCAVCVCVRVPKRTHIIQFHTYNDVRLFKHDTKFVCLFVNVVFFSVSLRGFEVVAVGFRCVCAARSVTHSYPKQEHATLNTDD